MHRDSMNKIFITIFSVFLFLICSCTSTSFEKSTAISSAIPQQPATVTPTVTESPQPTIPTAPEPTAIVTDHSPNYSGCIPIPLSLNDQLLDIYHGGHYFTDWEINETGAILTSSAGDSLQLKQIAADDESVIFSMNDRKFQIEPGGLVLISIFDETQEIAGLIWAPHSNQFVYDGYGNFIPPAIRLGYEAGFVDDSPPSYFQEKDWCIKEIQWQVEAATEFLESNSNPSDDTAFNKLLFELNDLISSHRHDCYQLIFPNQASYSWGRDDAGSIHCPLVQPIE